MKLTTRNEALETAKQIAAANPGSTVRSSSWRVSVESNEWKENSWGGKSPVSLFIAFRHTYTKAEQAEGKIPGWYIQ
jgi:hypothetical protein